MRFTRFQAMFLVVVLHYILPLSLLGWCLAVPYGSRAELLLRCLLAASYSLFIILAGTWAFASFYIRFAIAVTVIVTVAGNLIIVLPSSAWLGHGPGFIIQPGTELLITVFLARLVAGAFRARFHNGPVLDLALPFVDGVIAVFEGGNGQRSPLMNYHYASATHSNSAANRSMMYAVDLTRLSRWGNDANGFFPTHCDRYPVFHSPVLSPCNGQVIDLVDDRPNEVPWSGECPYNIGNYILLRTDSCHVLLGHLQAGSVRVHRGDSVSTGDLLATVGNSGWTSQPHLHLQAMRIDEHNFWNGEGIPVAFDGRVAFKNRLYLFRKATIPEQ